MITTYKPTEAGAEMLTEAQAKLDKCDQLSAGLDRLEAELAEAQAVVEAATAKRSQLLADRALATDPAEVKSFATPLKKLAEAAAEATLTLEAVTIAHQALEARLLEAEAEIQESKEWTLSVMVGQFAATARDQVADELAGAAKALVPILLKTAALLAATEDRDLARVLNELAIVLPGQRSAVLTGNLSQLDGQLQIRTAWRDVPELVELYEAASAGRLMAAKLRGYTPRKARMKAAAPYERKGYSMGGELTRVGMATRAETEASASAPVPPAAAKASATAPDERRDPLLQKPLRTGSSRPPAEIVDGNVAAGMLNNLMRD